MKLKSKSYIIHVKDNVVMMACSQTNMPHSLSNLCITYNDLDFYIKTKDMGYEKQAQALKEVILSGNIKRLNKITGEQFVIA